MQKKPWFEIKKGSAARRGLALVGFASAALAAWGCWLAARSPSVAADGVSPRSNLTSSAEGRPSAEMIGTGPADRFIGAKDANASPRSPKATADAEPTPTVGASVQGQFSSPRIARLLAGLSHGMDRLRFDELFSGWLNRLSLGETSIALADLRSTGIDAALADDLAARLLRHLSEMNVNAALGEINTLPPGDARTLALESLASVWAAQQLDTAVAWAGRLPEGGERDRALFAVANEAVRTQPAQALSLADELPADPARDELVRRAVGEWAASDPSAAISWARGIDDEALRAQVFAQAATNWSERDPAAAAAFALAELPSGRLQQDAVASVAQRWAQQSPEAAEAWVGTLSDSDLQLAAAASVAAIKTQRKANAAQGLFNPAARR